MAPPNTSPMTRVLSFVALGEVIAMPCSHIQPPASNSSMTTMAIRVRVRLDMTASLSNAATLGGTGGAPLVAASRFFDMSRPTVVRVVHVAAVARRLCPTVEQLALRGDGICINRIPQATRSTRWLAAVVCFANGRPMTRDDRKLAELVKVLAQLRDDLNDLSTKVNAEPRNTSLVIRRVNLMGRIVAAQASVDVLRGGANHGL
jgi:hypothetical protein